MALQWVTGRVTRKHVWSDGLFTLHVQCPGIAPFESGQFLQVGMQLPEKHLHRPYSVASPHGDAVEFFIVRVENGELTPRLWEIREGDPIDISQKGTGGFVLSHTPAAKSIWLMATGTGLAPYIAMLREGKIWDRYERVFLVHGVRMQSDLAYTDEMTQMQEKNRGRFQWVPVISRQQVPNAISGRITQAIEDGQLEERMGEAITQADSVVMMCGNPLMLDDVESLLTARGLKKHKTSAPGQIVVERYW